jgi:hypothetical protein
MGKTRTLGFLFKARRRKSAMTSDEKTFFYIVGGAIALVIFGFWYSLNKLGKEL